MAAGGGKVEKGIVTTYVKARANCPNVLMSEYEWMVFCYSAGLLDAEAPVLLCVNRTKHSEVKEYRSLDELNQHLAICFPGQPPLVKDKCSLGPVDFPEPKTGGEKKARTS